MDLISLPVEFDKKKVEGRYMLVTAVARRAKDLYGGAQARIASKSRKMTTVALEELVTNAVSILTGESALKAREEAKKLTYEHMMDEAKQKESLPEDMTELEKDLKTYLHKKGEDEGKKTINEIFPEEDSEKGSE